MAYNLEEQEQIDELKAFWNRYGNLLTTLALLVALAVAGWAGWQRWQDYQASKAAAVYAQLQQAVTLRDAGKVKAAAQQVLDDYSRTSYAQMAALLAARAHADLGDAGGAKAMLQWAIDHAKDEEFRHVARVRLAGLLLDEKAYDAGLALLVGNPPERFAAQYADRRGDLLFAQGRRDEARAAYKQAFDKLGDRSPLKEVVRLKLDALGGASA